MRKIKNNMFYTVSFLIYLFLMVVFIIISKIFFEPSAINWLIGEYSSRRDASADIIEVIIDGDTAKAYPKTTRTKEFYTDILDFFATYAKPKVVGYDILTTTINENPTKLDRDFINTIGKMDNLVLAYFAEDNQHNSTPENILKTFENKNAINVKLKTTLPDTIYTGAGVSSNALLDAAHNYGTVEIDPNEQTGTLFRYNAITKINDKFMPSLAMKMYLLANNTNDIIIDDQYITIPKTGLKIEYSYDEGRLSSYIRFYEPIQNTEYTHLSVSALTILDTYKALKKGITPSNHPELFMPQKPDGYVNPEVFKDRVILIGGHEPGSADDVLKTPVHLNQPGVDIHATVYDNYANGHSLKMGNGIIALLSFFLLSLISFIIILKTKFLKGLISVFLLGLSFAMIVAFIAIHGCIYMFATPLICQFVTSIFAYSFKFLAENRNKEQIKNAMGKYLSQDVMKNVVKNIDDLKLGGKRAVITVLFSDIRGFTSMSENLSADEVSDILNEYFAEMEPIITKYNGVINKFIGDAIMALFGEPINDENHPSNAVKCAYEMLKKVEYLKEKWIFEGKPKFEIGVGINTGEAFIGNIGTETRMEYTAIGDTVNLASRIEGYNKVYKTNLLVSSSTYAHISEIADVIKIKEVQIRGKAKKMDIYEVLRIEL